MPALVLPVFAVIVTGWSAGALGYLPRSLAGPLVQFAYNVAMPALVFVTIAREPLATLLDWKFLAAFGGGSLFAFGAVALAEARLHRRSLGESVVVGALASMTNTGFVALPILQALYGDRGVVPAAIATAFVGIVMFPLAVVLLELARLSSSGRPRTAMLVKQVMLNPAVLSTGAGLLWSSSGITLPVPVAAYMGIVGEALTPCALFAVGLGLSLEGLRRELGRTLAVSAMKLLVTPVLVLSFCLVIQLGPFATASAVICAAVPTAKTAYVLAGACQMEERTAGAVVSMTTLVSMVTVPGWISVLAR